MSEKRHVLGLMSGTSLDGVDLCYSSFWKKSGQWLYRIHQAETIKYPPNWRKKLTFDASLRGDQLLLMDHEYGLFLAKAVLDFLTRHRISSHQIDLIASHGHTYYHRPDLGFSFQLGNGPEIFVETGIKTICDFRRQDVSLGGQGAPLVPIGDQLLFSEYDACLNIGGFANISFHRQGRRVAGDICAVNFVLNYFANKLGKDFDRGGEIAASSEIDRNLLARLNSIPFYQKKPPKSLGAEWVHETIFPRLAQSNLPFEEIIATYTAHAAKQVSNILSESEISTCLVTGGGAYNDYFIKSIQKQCSTALVLPEPNIIEFKEALIFGFMGLLKELEEPNILASVTGSRKDHSSGITYHT